MIYCEQKNGKFPLDFRENELSRPSFWNTAYELMYQWIGQYITPFSWSDAPVNKALNSFLASMTTVDVRVTISKRKQCVFKIIKKIDELVADQPRRNGREVAYDNVVFSVLRIWKDYALLESCWN